MKRFGFIVLIMMAVCSIPSLMLIRPADGQGVLLIGLLDNVYKIGAQTVQSNSPLSIPNRGALVGINQTLSEREAVSNGSYTGTGTYQRYVGTAQGGTNTIPASITLAAASNFADNALAGWTITTLQGTGADQTRTIISNTQSDDKAVVDADAAAPHSYWQTVPSTDTVYELIPPSGICPRTEAYVNSGASFTYGARVENITIDGKQSGAGGQEHQDAGPSTSTLIDLDSVDGTVEFARVHRVKGDAIRMTNSVTPGSQVSTYGPFNQAMQVRFSEISSCHRGIYLDYNDGRIFGNMIVGFRDAGIQIPSGRTAIQIMHNHVYGSGEYGACLLLQSQDNMLHNNELADAYIGAKVTAANNTFSDCYFQHDWHRSALLLVSQTHINDSWFSVPQEDATHTDIVGIELSQLWTSATASTPAHNTIIDDCHFAVNWFPFPGQSGYNSATAVIKINDNCGNGIRITNCRFDGRDDPGFTNRRGIQVVDTLRNATIDVACQGFNQSGDVFLDFDTADIYGCDITVRETPNASMDPSNLLTIPTGWGSRGNTITLYDANGTKTTLTDGQAYP